MSASTPVTAISTSQLSFEVFVLDSRRPCVLERMYGMVWAVTTAFYQVRAHEESGAIKAIVTMSSHMCPPGDDWTNQRIELVDDVLRRWLL